MVLEKTNHKFTDGSNSKDFFRDYKAEKWLESDVPELRIVEESSWAPWLRFPENAIAHIRSVYPDGQFLLRHDNKIIAHLATTRIDWDGDIESLPSWDAAAGASVSDVNLTKMLKTNGNAICLLSMSVLPDYRHYNLSSTLIQAVEDYGRDTKAASIIGPFRPSNYGQWRREQRRLTQESNTPKPTDFETYITVRDPRGRLYDRWLGIVSAKHGVRLVKIEPEAMVVEVDESELDIYRLQYKPDAWDELEPNRRYDCTAEAGLWTVENGIARYTETNYWGVKSLK